MSEILPMSKKKIKVSPAVIDQSIHHLRNFLTLITSMSNNACAKAQTPEAEASARRQFFQLFGEVVSTVSALDEAINPSGNDELARQLEGLKASDEYKEMMLRGERDRILECYRFLGGKPRESVMRPGELCFDAALRHPCKDFGGWLLGKRCTIDGADFAVMAVEYAPLKPPFSAGDVIGLVVRSCAENGDVTETPEWRAYADAHGFEGDAPEGCDSEPCAASPAQGDAEGGPGLRIAASAD